MIFYTPTEKEVYTQSFKYMPRSCFVITQLGGKISNRLIDIRKMVSKQIQKRNLKEIDAGDKVGKDFLMKIWKIAISVPIGIAIITQDMSKKTIGNIFYELGLMDSLGKDTIIIKDSNCDIASDLVRTDYIEYNNQAANKLHLFFDNVFETAGHCEAMADYMEAKPILSLDYLRRAYLITGKEDCQKKAEKLFKEHEDSFEESTKLFVKNFINS